MQEGKIAFLFCYHCGWPQNWAAHIKCSEGIKKSHNRIVLCLVMSIIIKRYRYVLFCFIEPQFQLLTHLIFKNPNSILQPKIMWLMGEGGSATITLLKVTERSESASLRISKFDINRVCFSFMFVCLVSKHVWICIEYVMNYCFYGATERLINHCRNEQYSIYNAL